MGPGFGNWGKGWKENKSKRTKAKMNIHVKNNRSREGARGQGKEIL
jgi:hypothetical protein